jgi:acyl-CoA reductase-like NAD-dependent aldehyde dehydrogenase
MNTTETTAIRNPRTGELDYQVKFTSAEAVQTRCQELRSAQAEWYEGGLEHRIEILRRWRQALASKSDQVADALTLDTGRRMLSQLEVQGIVQRIEHWCERAPSLLKASAGASESQPSVRYEHQLVPYPLVSIISPWNFPMTLGLIDTIPALLAGCAVYLKPSEITPRFAEPLRESLQQVPELAKVFDIAIGGPDTGKAMIDNSSAVCFTGSVETGRKVAAHAASCFIPAFLELGGKDPAIVLASSDIDNAVKAIIRSAIGSAGQACMSLERVYVDRGIKDQFLESLTTAVEAIELNYPDLNHGHIGPLIFARQAEKIQQQLDDAKHKGATVHCGGEVKELGGGLWCLPTVVSDIRDDMILMTEETFGPVIPVITFDTADEAINAANNSSFGLSASVFAGTIEEAREVALRINAGAVNINDASLTAMVHDVEKNSFGLSGMGGSRMGDSGLLRFMRKKALLIQQAPASSLDVFNEANTST